MELRFTSLVMAVLLLKCKTPSEEMLGALNWGISPDNASFDELAAAKAASYS